METLGNLGHKGSRAKRGPDSYYKGRYYIAFYKQEEDGDESFYAGFNNVVDICKHLGWPVDPQNLNRVHQALYKSLYKSECACTKLIDGVRLKVCLIDMSEERNEDERRENMKKFVKINSTANIEVYPDLGAIDATNVNSPMADRLSAKPNWVYPVMIRQGIHYYPAEIKEWAAVKKLNSKNVLSVSEEVDEIPTEEKEACDKLVAIIEKMKRRPGQPKQEAKKEPKKEHKAEAKQEPEA